MSAAPLRIIQLSNSPTCIYKLQTRVIAPCVVRLQGTPVVKRDCLPHLPQRGARNAGRFTAPAAPRG